MKEREIKVPIGCDGCPFHQRYDSFFEDSKLYPQKAKPLGQKLNTKYDFCKLEKIVIYEKE